jgi:hypothetical protein
MGTNGLLEVHDTVTFEANTAAANGGAVSPRSNSIAHLSGVS